MNKEKLLYLLTQNEGPKLDFKEDFNMDLHSKRSELSKDIIAMANSQGGRGYLIYGIEDKTKKIKGVAKEKFAEERIQQLITMTVDPPVNIRIEYFEVKEKDIVTITIFKSHNRPHQSRQTGAFYIRRGSTTDTARIDEIAALFQKSNLIGNEKLPLYNLDINILDFNMINDYLNKSNIIGESDNLELLSDIGIISYDGETREYVPSVGGILFFTKLPQNYLTYVGIKIINDLGEEKKIINLKGNLTTLYKNAKDVVKDLIDFMPLEGIDEAIGNAIIHRDYFDNTREIVIYLSKNQIIISNPGSTIGNIRFDNIIKEKNHKRRNFWLYKTFLILDDENNLLKNNNGLKFIKDYYDGIADVHFLASREMNIFKVAIKRIKGSYGKNNSTS
ncbi:MAG TPA: RNA-binding domain-containing protein [Clostridia bacterium]|nr:RNA-binding domain-containing protein [Clostridia bacterium]